MYLPRHFEVSDARVLRDFIRAHPLATLVIADASGLSADHIPLLLEGDDDRGWTLAGHVARANPVWKKALADTPCLVIFHGPQHYISPNWYATKQETGKAVPTWNYEVVHVNGRVRAIEERDWLGDFLERLTDTHEADQPTPWRMDEAPKAYLEQMMAAVVGLEIEVVTMTGKSKMSQNQPKANQDSVAAGLMLSRERDGIRMANAIKSRE